MDIIAKTNITKILTSVLYLFGLARAGKKAEYYASLVDVLRSGSYERLEGLR